jgi:hypothetical protein
MEFNIYAVRFVGKPPVISLYVWNIRHKEYDEYLQMKNM